MSFDTITRRGRLTVLCIPLLLGFAACSGNTSNPAQLAPNVLPATSSVISHGPALATRSLSKALSTQPFLIACLLCNSNVGTIYTANATFTKLTPLVQVGGIVNATAVGPNNELFASVCTATSQNPADYYDGYAGVNCEILGQTNIYSSTSQPPTIIPYGGNGVAVASNGRFASIGPAGGSLERLEEFEPATTSPSLTLNVPELAYTLAINSKGSALYFDGLPYAVVERFPWLKSTPNFTYNGSSPSGHIYLAPHGVLYQDNYGGSYENSPTSCTYGQVNVFPKGASVPSYSITDGIDCPVGLTIYNGNLYVANAGPSQSSAHVSVYALGQTSPKATYPLPFLPTSLSRSVVP